MNKYTGQFRMISVKPRWWQIFKKPYMKFQLQTERRVVEEFEGTNIEDSVEYEWVDAGLQEFNYLLNAEMPPLEITAFTISESGCGILGEFSENEDHRKC